MKIKLQSLDETRKAHLTRQADKTAAEFEGQRDLDNVCMVVDMVRVRIVNGTTWEVAHACAVPCVPQPN